MKRPAVFFDRDNTLILAADYLGEPAQVRLNDGAADAVAEARRLGYATVVVSNQSGVARGMFDEAAVRAVNARLDEMLHAANPGAIIDRHEFCPTHPEAAVEEYRADDARRKPAPGMILDAAGALALDVSRSWMIGDAPRDIEAGHAAGCATILLKQANLPQSPAASEPSSVEPDFVAASLAEALDLIERATNNPAHLPPPQPPEHEHQHLHHLVQLSEQILIELKRRDEQTRMEFSISKLLAGVMQIVALAVLFVAYLNRNEQQFQTMMGVAIFLQLFTISLLMMGKDREN